MKTQKTKTRKARKPGVRLNIAIQDKLVSLEFQIPSKWLLITASTLATIFGSPKIIDLLIKLLEYK